MSKSSKSSKSSPSFSALLRAPSAPVDLAAIDTRATPGFERSGKKGRKGRKADKKAGRQLVADQADHLAELQEKLFANGYTDGSRSLLLVVQGMDTSGKGGVLKHCVGVFDPGGVRITSFKKPTEEELAHDFLWRVEKVVPEPGQVGIFDRSHYEDVLVARVHELAPADEIERRYDAINAFEQRLVEAGTTIVKVMLHISADEQRDRLLARLDEPVKRWKYKPGDVDERSLWPSYQEAYALALERCSTDAAPWYVVPADRKWYRDVAIVGLLREALEAMDLSWPEPDYDLEAERRRLAG